MAAIAIFLLALYAAVLTVLTVRRRGGTATLKSIKLPFAEFDVHSFENLSKVRFFAAVTRVLRPTDLQLIANQRRVAPEDLDPNSLVFAGWNLVADAFILRFGVPPTDDALALHATKLGSQNIELLKVYRDVYRAVFSYDQHVTRKFAVEYVSRAPSLCDRINADQHVDWQRRFTTLDQSLGIYRLSLEVEAEDIQGATPA